MAPWSTWGSPRVLRVDPAAWAAITARAASPPRGCLRRGTLCGAQCLCPARRPDRQRGRGADHSVTDSTALSLKQVPIISTHSLGEFDVKSQLCKSKKYSHQQRREKKDLKKYTKCVGKRWMTSHSFNLSTYSFVKFSTVSIYYFHIIS